MKFFCGNPTHLGDRGTADLTCETCMLLTRHREAVKQSRVWAKERRKTPWSFEGVDLRKVAKGFRRLPAFDDETSQYRLSHGPRVHVTWSGARYSVSGNARSGGRVHLKVGPLATMARVLEVLLHEVVHSSLPPDDHHGVRFILRLVRAAREAWGVAIEKPLDVPKGTHKNRAYAVDALILEALNARIARDPDAVLPPKEPPSAPIDHERARLELVERKAANARKLLELHERKQRREAKLVAKWRCTVRRYERVAAKVGELKGNGT